MEWSEDSWDIDLKERYTGGRGHFVRDTHGNSVYGGSKASKFELRLDEVNDMDLFVRQSAYPQLTLTSSSSPSHTLAGNNLARKRKDPTSLRVNQCQ